MRRGLDTVRYILVTVEPAGGEVEDCALCDAAHDIREVAFHAEFLRENGLIEADVSYVAEYVETDIGSHPSGYGSTNEYEYFAESFASMTGGRPNAHGKALRDWIKKNS